MNLSALIDSAAASAGGKGALARELGQHPNRIGEWRSGARRPDATEIVYMARRAGLPEAETLAEIEEQLDPRFPGLWSGLLGKLKAAGVAASVAFVAYLMPAHDAKATPAPALSNGSAAQEIAATTAPTKALDRAAICIM